MARHYFKPLAIVLGTLCLLIPSIVFGGQYVLESKRKAGLQVITDEISTSIFINDQYLDKAPFIGKNFKPGEYTVRMQPDDPNFTPYETKVTLRKGLLTVITWKPGVKPELSGGVIYEMEPIGGTTSELSFVTIPDGAIVSVDGGDKQFTPLVSKNITPGQHEYEVTLPSYGSQKHTINAVRGHRMLITIKLAKGLSGLEESSARSASGSASPTQATQTTPSGNSPTASTSARAQQASASASRSGLVPPQPPYVTVKPTDFFLNGQEVLRVRTAPSNVGDTLGAAPVGRSYSYLGETTNDWHKISFEGKTGWVHSQYVTLVTQ